MTRNKYLAELPWKDSYMELISPIPVKIENDYYSCAITSEDFGIVATGLDYEAALQEFAISLENIVDSLQSIPKENLTSDQKTDLERLESFLPLDEEFIE